MRKAIPLLLLLLPSFLWAETMAHASRTLAFTHVTVIDASGTGARPDMTVVISGERISATGSAAQTDIPQDAQLIEGAGKFLIPGLWDMHVHLGVTGMDYRPFFPLFIANGITGVRDMGGALHQGQFDVWRQEIEQGVLLGPRLVVAVTIVDGPRPVRPLISIATGNAAAGRLAVDSLRRSGSDFVKVYSLLPREVFFAIAEEARKQNISFAGHVPDSVTAAEASDAGQKSIEHLTGVGLSSATNEDELRAKISKASTQEGVSPDADWLARVRIEREALAFYSPQKAARLFARFVENATWQCPTLTVLRATLEGQNFGATLALVNAMHQAGVEFLAGTDAPSPQCAPGSSLHDELELLVEAGLTPMQALKAATLGPARYLGREEELGTIGAGKLADLVLLAADPLEDIRNTRKIDAVVVDGRLLSRQELDRMMVGVARTTNPNP